MSICAQSRASLEAFGFDVPEWRPIDWKALGFDLTDTAPVVEATPVQPLPLCICEGCRAIMCLEAMREGGIIHRR